MDVIRRHLQAEGAISQELLFDLIERAADIFDREPNLLKLDDPITVVGDIHGQYWDLLKLIDVGGAVGETRYLFLGDYVDRGSFSVEVMSFLLACKVAHPTRIFMLRGNHECRQMTAFFNFREECEYKYDLSIYNAFMEAFDTLPLGALINNKYFACHGGISPELTKISQIAEIDRMREPPKDGIFCDLIWADPNGKEDTEGAPKVATHFQPNDARGCSYFFSAESAAKFLKKNNLLCVIRAHEAQAEGYKMHKTNPATGFPGVITVFSAPNYCDSYKNKAAILKFENSTLNVMQFNCSPHPYHLPNFMDVFSWSIPFVIEKILEFTDELLAARAEHEEHALPPELQRACEESNLKNDPLILVRSIHEHIEAEAAKKAAAAAGVHERKGPMQPSDLNRLRRKVRVVGRMARMFKTLRDNNEKILKLKGVCPGHRLQPGILLEGKERIRDELEMFGFVRSIDSENEARPEGEEGAQEIVMTKSLSLHQRKHQQRKSPKEILMEEAAQRE